MYTLPHTSGRTEWTDGGITVGGGVPEEGLALSTRDLDCGIGDD